MPLSLAGHVKDSILAAGMVSFPVITRRRGLQTRFKGTRVEGFPDRRGILGARRLPEGMPEPRLAEPVKTTWTEY